MKKVAPNTGVVDNRPLLTLDDVADRLKISRRTVQRWIEAGQLRGVHFGRSVRVHEADLEAFIDAHRS